jgi:hypothetical protein
MPATAQELGLRGGFSQDAVPVMALPEADAAIEAAATPPGSQPAVAVPETVDTATTTGSVPAETDAKPSPNVIPPEDPEPRAKPRRSAPQASDALIAPAPPLAAKSTQSAAEDDGWLQPQNPRAQPIRLEENPVLDGGAERAFAIERLARARDDDPFAAVGIRAGSFILRPSLEQGLTATSNADSSFGGGSALLSETTLRLNALSDWRRHTASADGTLTWRRTISGAEVKDVRGRVDGALTLDLERDLSATARLGYEAVPESASSPVSIGGAISQPLRQTFNGSLSLDKAIGKARFGLTGAAEHETYGDAELTTGPLSQKDRDSTLYSATLRGGYAISPALTPFVEIEAGRRLYDQRVDSGGYERSATRLGARAGVELDLGEKLAGEFSAGWLREALDDDRLAPVSGATVNANLRWSPERGTNVALSGATTVEGTTTPGESGSILYWSQLSLERQIRSNLTGKAALGAGWRDYVGSNGHDLTLSAEASLTWWLSRYAGLTTRVRTEKLTSNIAGREETTNSVFLGLRLQR